MVDRVHGHGNVPPNKPQKEVYSVDLHHLTIDVNNAAEDRILDDIPNWRAATQTSRTLAKRSVTWESGNKAGGDAYIVGQRAVFSNRSVKAQAQRWGRTDPFTEHKSAGQEPSAKKRKTH